MSYICLVMTVFSAQLAEGGGACPLPSPFHPLSFYLPTYLFYPLDTSYVALSAPYPAADVHFLKHRHLSIYASMH
jgi:hypothetical protein